MRTSTHRVSPFIRVVMSLALAALAACEPMLTEEELESSALSMEELEDRAFEAEELEGNAAENELGDSTLALTATTSLASKRALVVVSAATVLPLQPVNGSPRSIPTGYFLNELAEALRQLETAGYAIDIATPGGVFPTIDINSFELYFYKLQAPLDPVGRRNRDIATAQKYFGRLRFSNNTTSSEVTTFVNQVKAGQSTLVERTMLRMEDLAYSSTALSAYSGMYVPGGHAPKVDLLYSSAFGRILRHFHDLGKPTAIICHAPVTLLTTLPRPWYLGINLTESDLAAFPYRGYKVAIGNMTEEWILEQFLYLNGNKLLFYVEPQVRAAGIFPNPGLLGIPRAPATPEVVVDRELLTGANPASTDRLSREFVKALDTYVASY